jgi:hypothetical protein
MPPAGAPRPDAETLTRLTRTIESTLDRQAAAHPHPGSVPSVHRLNRAEYANAIRDLLAVPIDATLFLPPDDSGFGFDNIADVLSVSPMLTERYLSAATKISRVAVGSAAIRPSTETFTVGKYLVKTTGSAKTCPLGHAVAPPSPTTFLSTANTRSRSSSTALTTDGSVGSAVSTASRSGSMGARCRSCGSGPMPTEARPSGPIAIQSPMALKSDLRPRPVRLCSV